MWPAMGGPRWHVWVTRVPEGSCGTMSTRWPDRQMLYVATVTPPQQHRHVASNRRAPMACACAGSHGRARRGGVAPRARGGQIDNAVHSLKNATAIAQPCGHQREVPSGVRGSRRRAKRGGTVPRAHGGPRKNPQSSLGSLTGSERDQ